MKKIIMCFVLIFAMLPLSAFAAAGDQEVTATKAGDFHVLYNGVEQAFTDVNGTGVIPIVYEGTTYLPVRAISNLAGLNVEWNPDTKTVRLATGGAKSTYDGKPGAAVESVKVVMSSTVTITLDGEVQSFKDANGKIVYPLSYEGTTYLPVRAVCGLVNISVEWDGTTNTVILGTKPASSAALPVEIPAGAKVLTGDDVKLSGAETSYADGVFTLKNGGLSPFGGYLDFTNNGYTTLTFTVMINEKPHGVNVLGVDGIHAESRLCVDQEANTSKTYTADISGIKNVQMQFMSGAYCNATVTGIYLSTPSSSATPSAEIPAGAKELTGFNTTLKGDGSSYSNGVFTLSNGMETGTGGYIKFTNDGYTTITFTVTVKGNEHGVTVVGADGITADARLIDIQDADTTKTYTVDISGIKNVEVRVAYGFTCDATVRFVYLS